jgi:N-methylhydantoinase B
LAVWQLAELEVFRHRIASVAEGMGATLQRCAFSANIKERMDYSCAVFDRRGRLLAQAAHIPVHLGAMPASVAAARAEHKHWQPGDVVLLNDPRRGGSHLPDITTISPVFLDSRTEPTFFVATRAHHADVGGGAPGSLALARDIYGEGLVLPPLPLVLAGQLQAPILSLICANSRTPDERRGDLEAQIAAHRHGEARLTRMAAGLCGELDRLGGALFDYSARLAASRLRGLSTGSGFGWDEMDGDGLSDRRYPIQAQVKIEDGRLYVDFCGSAAAADSGINAPRAVTEAAVYYLLACLIGDCPVNAGSMSVAEIRIPNGGLLDPPAGAAVAAGNVETSQRIVDVLLKALAQIAPEIIPADSQGSMNNLTIGGWVEDPIDGTRQGFSYYETLPGGAGGGPGQAGASAIQVHMTNTSNTPVEALESALPIRVEAMRIRRGSGGAGRFPGGDGIERRMRMLVPVRLSLMTERRRLAPFGLAGGMPGARGENRIVRAEGTESVLAAKGSFDFEAGDELVIRTPGGGGWGVADAESPDEG